MDIDEFLKLARTRRSIRKFKANPVPDECVEKMLEAARWAMSGANGQPWEFLVIKNRETIGKLAEIDRRYRETARFIEMTRFEEYRQPSFRTPDYAEPNQAAIQRRYTIWETAPLAIVVLGDYRTMSASTLNARLCELHVFDHNLANATTMLHLAAAACGLGAQWVSILPHPAEEMKLLLGVPPLLTIFTINPIGYPAMKPAPYRRQLSEMVHYEKYDMSRFRSTEQVLEFIKYQRQRHAKGGTYASEK